MNGTHPFYFENATLNCQLPLSPRPLRPRRRRLTIHCSLACNFQMQLTRRAYKIGPLTLLWDLPGYHSLVLGKNPLKMVP